MDGGIDTLKLGERDMLSFLRPDTLVGALVYLALFLFIGLVLSRLLRAAVHAAMIREGRIDRGGIGFVQQLGTALIWVMIVILYAHLIPVLRALGTAMLAGAGVASVVIGLAAQSTLGNLVAGISITIYRPFRLGDTLQVTTPTGTEIGVVEWISLGYTTLGTADGRLVVLPNSVVANQVNLNLNKTYKPAQTSVTIRCARTVDADKVAKLASEAATEVLGAAGVTGCYLTKIDGTDAVFDLRVQMPDIATRESTRAHLLAHLAQRFAQADLGANAAPASFS
jgi:small-conductance mechanosensitive channel